MPEILTNINCEPGSEECGYYDGCIMTVTDNICMGLRERGLLNSTHISTSVVRYTLTPAGRAAIEEGEG